MEEKPTVLILGGCGFIGRNLAAHLVTNDLAQYIRIVDKVPPQVAWFNQQHQDVFQSSIVEFKSANLINSESCKNAFNAPNNIGHWDFVINCAGETKPAQTDPVYKEGVYKLSLNCANQAAISRARRYVEISSGQMYSSEKIPHCENDDVEPWTLVSKWKRKVETDLYKIPNLNYTVLRPAIVYGIGDKSGLMPRIMVAAIYKQLGETMKLLWGADLKLNTLHIEDLCRAVWFVCNREDTVRQTYNVVDEANSTQGSISELLIDMFNIKVGYYGNLLSSAIDSISAADEANDKHLKPWAEACRGDGIQNTPLSPHTDSEWLLQKNLRLDGTKLKKLGFELSIPKPTCERIMEIVNDYVEMGVFPPSLVL